MNVETIDTDRTFSGRLDSGQHIEEGGLTRTAGAHNADQLAGTLGNMNVMQSDRAIREPELLDIGIEGKFRRPDLLAEEHDQIAVIQRGTRCCLYCTSVGKEINPSGLHDEAIQVILVFTQVAGEIHIDRRDPQEEKCAIQVGMHVFTFMIVVVLLTAVNDQEIV